MEVIQSLHMNGADKHDTSYANNSLLQREIISLGDAMIEEALTKICSMNKETLISMGIADLGCSSGPNSLTLVSKVIEMIQIKSRCRSRKEQPELRVSLNDLPGNDFNYLIKRLPDFYSKIKREMGIERCFVSCVGGSFYGRLFPQNSLHFVHSSSSLHWLSQVPSGLQGDKKMNKGKVYISKSSPPSVVKAYLHQFRTDFFQFLRCRADETVSGGQMVLSFMGRASPDPSAQVGSHQWELLAEALMSMAKQGLIEEEKIDSFNAPYYAPSAMEIKGVIENEGSFFINHLKECEIRWDQGCNNGFNNYEVGKLSKGQRFAKLIRAVVESMLESILEGETLMDELFRRYGELVDDYFAQSTPIYINMVISLTKA